MKGGSECSDVSVLFSRLQALSRPQSAIVSSGPILGTDDPRENLIAKIAETQLPRRLIFTNDRSEAISFFANGGRLMGVEYTACSGENRFYRAARTETPNQAVRAEPVAEALERFLGSTARITVRSQRFDLNTFQNHEERDPPASLDIGKREAIQPSPLAAFSDQFRTQVEALVVWKGGEFQVPWGDPSLLNSLKSLATEEGASHDEQDCIGSEDTPKPACAIYSGHPAGGRSVFCATQSGAILLALCKYEKTTELISLWQSYLAE